MKYLKDKFRFSLKTKKSISAYFFISPFLLGFTLFVLHPLISSVIYSFGELEFLTDSFRVNFIGLENYRFALGVHGSFTKDLITNTSLAMIGNIFWVLVFSFFAASILNQQFKGRMLARIIFFLPVILTSGILLRMEMQDYMLNVIQEGAEHGLILSQTISQLLLQLRFPEGFMVYVLQAIDNIPYIIRSSGVQILIFLAGLQSISPSLYEAAKVDGSTAWEEFWKITLPLISPLILTNIVYTIVDYFTSPQNHMVEFIKDIAFESHWGFGVSAAMSWIYFIVIAIFVAITIKIVSKHVFYNK